MEEILELRVTVVDEISSIVSSRNGLINPGLLESALDRPKHAAHYQNADVLAQAATLLCGLIHNHPFLDGNKRTAWTATETFLNMNGWLISASEDELFALVIDIVNHAYDTDDAEAWIRERAMSSSFCPD